MTFKEFELEMIKLGEVFGEKKYIGARRNMMWNKFEKVPVKLFRDCIERLICYEQYAPMMDKFEVILGPWLAEHKAAEIEKLQNSVNCTICRGTGTQIVKIVVTKPYNYGLLDHAFRCDCLLGEMLAFNLPKYKKGGA